MATKKTTESTKATKQAKKVPARAAKATVDPQKKLGALDADALVLEQTGQPMTTRELIEAMAVRRLWTSPGGETPWGTLSAAIAREIKLTGKDSRFAKTDRGKFARA
jgi:hypothetical protein